MKLRRLIAYALLAVPVLVFITGFVLQLPPEEWAQYLVYSILVPLVVQLLRLLAARGVGFEIRGWVARGLSFAIAILYVFLVGGFSAIVPPVYDGDPINFIGPLLAFLVAVYSPIELMYRLIVKSIEDAAPKLAV